MKLTYKISVLLFIFWFFLLLGYIFTYSWVVKPTLIQLEKELSLKDLERFHKILEKELQYLNRTCADYAWWDDTYQFVVDKNETYKRVNLLPQTFEENKINMILIVNNLGEVVFGEWYDLEKKEKKALPIEFSSFKISLTHPLLSFKNIKSGKYGIVTTNYGTIAVSSNKILNSKVEGEPQGVFIIGKLLNDEFWDGIRNQFMQEFFIYPYYEKDKLISNAYSFPYDEEKTIWIQEDKDNNLLLWDVIRDIYETPVFLVRLTHKQNIVSVSDDMQFRGIISFFIIILVGITALWIVMKRQIISPIQSLTQNIKISAYHEKISTLPYTQKNDEIALLIVQFNRMAYRINKLLEEKSKLLGEIEERERYLKFIFDAVPCVIMEMDTRGYIKSINSTVRQIIGREPIEVENKNACEIFPLKGMFEFIDKISKMEGETGEIEKYEFEELMINSQNEKKYLQVHFRRNERNGNVFYIGVIWDVTTLREIQAKYNEQKQLAVLGEASASLAHELRNMVSAIQGGFQLMERENNPQRREEILKELHISIARLEEMLRKLLEFTRKYTLKKNIVSLKTLIEEQYKHCISHYKIDKNILFSVKGDLEVSVDTNLFSRAIWNILMNSIESVEEEGKIEARLFERDNLYFIEIEDNGIGFEEENMEKIGTPFFTTKVHGTGLGLSISKKIIESHGGTIQIRSEKQKGTCVVITLPKDKE